MSFFQKSFPWQTRSGKIGLLFPQLGGINSKKANEQYPPQYTNPKLLQKISLYISAFISVPFYHQYGEIGSICYTIGKNILDGIILYTIFSMAEQELKVTASGRSS